MSSQTLSQDDLGRLDISSIDVAGKTVFFRTDLNVPMKDGVVTDTTRIDRTAEGMVELAEKGARVVVAAHFGRPKGRRVEDLTLAPIAPVLGKIMGREVGFVEDCIGRDVEAAIQGMNDGEIVLLENLRFHPEEEKGDEGFAKALAKSVDIFVNDTFSTSHRSHASIAKMCALLPSYAGHLMMEELQALAAALGAPKPPVAAVVGGAKVSTKLAVLNNLVKKVDSLIIGGGMANTFLYAQGHDIGASLAETDMAEDARQIMAAAEDAGCKIVLPTDAVLAREFKAGAASRVISFTDGEIGSDEMILDAGPETVEAAKTALDKANTVVWNGPMGAFEIAPFDAATFALAQYAAMRTKDHGLISVAGGGDTVAALIAAGADQDFHYVSTAGGAFLEWMEGKTLPGVAALLEA